MRTADSRAEAARAYVGSALGSQFLCLFRQLQYEMR